MSSGYEPFIRGVVDGILEKSNINYLNYVVIGSQLEIINGKLSEKYHINQFEKQKVVEYIIKNGGKIHFLADDSMENKDLFETVKQHNGITLNIKHIPNKECNEIWKSYLETLTFENIKENLINDNSYIGLNKENIEMPKLLQKLANYTNKIGVTHISIDEFYTSFTKLKHGIKDKRECIEFEKNIEKMVFQKDREIYLRGKLYYNWLPQYIFIDDKCIIERWKKLQSVSEKYLKIVNRNNLVNVELGDFEKIIIYEIIDHLLESMLFVLQHRTDENYIKNIKSKLCKRIIATVGLFQKDFKEYFWKLHDILDEKNDYILLDLSKHQPDLINNSESYKESLDRILILKDLVKQIRNNKVPIIIADDTTPKQMKKYLNILSENDIKVKGIDMQNIVELNSNEQKYQIIENGKKTYQIKIRKSPNSMYEWCHFLKKEEKNE